MKEEQNQNRGAGIRQSLEAAERRTPDVIPLHRAVMREMAEPRDGLEPAPVWLILAFLSLAGWGGWYIASYSGGFSGTQYNEQAAPASAAPAPKPADPMALGRRVFNNCVTCHQTDAQGIPGTYPALAGADRVLGQPEFPAAILLHGLHGPLKVKGQSFNGEMPDWGGKLNDEQIAAVLTYVRASFGNNAGPVSPDLVGRVRAATASRTSPWTDRELDLLTLPPGQ